MLDYERKASRDGFSLVVGVDEAGRGPLAGPVVASAVSLKDYNFQNKICDSKKLCARKREKAFGEIFEKAYVGIGIVNEAIIDEKNILEATYQAMSEAISQLVSQFPQTSQEKEKFNQKVILLIDGNSFKTNLPFAYWTIVKGDSLSLSIACASIVAKVTRDKILEVYDKVFPEYGFSQHKGYPTRQHKQAIRKHGLSVIHRKTFQYL
ncbi:MAG: ribonuclease HII [Candidatus Omnitrophota bacterium]